MLSVKGGSQSCTASLSSQHSLKQIDLYGRDYNCEIFYTQERQCLMKLSGQSDLGMQTVCIFHFGINARQVNI